MSAAPLLPRPSDRAPSGSSQDHGLPVARYPRGDGAAHDATRLDAERARQAGDDASTVGTGAAPAGSPLPEDDPPPF